MPAQPDDELLRCAALRTAKSILQARASAEGALKEQSDWLRITLASIADGVISSNAQGHVTFINAAAETLTGWSHADALGRPVCEVFRMVDAGSGELITVNAAQDAARTSGLSQQVMLLAKDGARRWVGESVAPMRDSAQKPIGEVLVFRDTSERKQAEFEQRRLLQEVRAGRERLAEVFDLSPAFMATLRGPEHVFELVNEHYVQHTGARQLIGRPARDALPEMAGQGFFESLDQVYQSGRALSAVEACVRMQRSAGAPLEERFVQFVFQPLRELDGSMSGVLVHGVDLTERRRAEAALRAREHRALREADARKDKFIALLAHELRNPLAPIRNGLQIMRLAANNASAVSKAMDMVDRQLEHMVRLVDDLMDVSRIVQDRMELRIARVLLSDIVDTAIETVQPWLQAGAQQLTVRLPEQPVYLQADLTRLAQVLSNLLSNSAKYSAPGGHIWLTAQSVDGYLELSVRDNGKGIPSESLASVFDMFSQVERSNDRAGGGLGIGLALVKGLVEMHGGSVSAASAGPGTGSTFSVRIPLHPAGSDAGQASVAHPSESSAPAKRILVVDDNEDSALTLGSVLELLGNEVRVAHDGVEAVESAQAWQPDVVLIDVGMPRMDGHEATRRIRQQSWDHTPVIIAITGWGQPSDRELSRAAGCDGHLVKPVKLVDLQNMLAELVH